MQSSSEDEHSNVSTLKEGSTESEHPPFVSLLPLIVIECIFTLVGGFMDAYAYIAHGHVFANAQTGNVVLFAVHATGGDWPQALRHLPPIAAFLMGVALAKILADLPQGQNFTATLLCQSIELLALTGLTMFASGSPNAFIVPVISFVAALQVSSFDAIGSWSFNSAMTTGNLKNMTTGLVLSLRGKEANKNRGKAIISACACISFLSGAVLGAFYTRRHEAHALAPCVLLVFTGILLTWTQRGSAHHAA